MKAEWTYRTAPEWAREAPRRTTRDTTRRTTRERAPVLGNFPEASSDRDLLRAGDAYRKAKGGATAPHDVDGRDGRPPAMAFDLDFDPDDPSDVAAAALLLAAINQYVWPRANAVNARPGLKIDPAQGQALLLLYCDAEMKSLEVASRRVGLSSTTISRGVTALREDGLIKASDGKLNDPTQGVPRLNKAGYAAAEHLAETLGRAMTKAAGREKDEFLPPWDDGE